MSGDRLEVRINREVRKKLRATTNRRDQARLLRRLGRHDEAAVIEATLHPTLLGVNLGRLVPVRTHVAVDVGPQHARPEVG